MTQLRKKHPSTFVGYFYFDRQRSEAAESASSWRAILSQLLHAFPGDQDIIEASILLQKYNTSGQPFASKTEILSLLGLVLEPFDQLFLVFDGIDECRDQELFLKDLSTLTRHKKAVRTALFSRPTVALPLEIQNNSVSFPLDKNQNFDEIVQFLLPSIYAMDGRSILPHNLDPQAAATLVAKRADGMFLWARMFLDYIKSPSLSLRQKREAILNINQFQGLDRLYEAIIQQILQSNDQGASQNIERALQLVAFSRRPLHVEELALAVVCPLDRAIEEDDAILDFSVSIGQFSGALLELDAKSQVRFLHSSAIEYITGGRQSGSNRTHQERGMLIDYSGGHRILALISLSYLYFTVHHGPLSGVKGVVADVRQQARAYPLLNYCSEYWSFHVLDYLQDLSNFPDSDEDRLLGQLASRFLSKAHAVMTWIEACWMFKRPPTIRYGRDDPSLEYFGSSADTDSSRLTPKAFAMRNLSRLSKDLLDLNRSWEHILCEEPAEIWEPSISAFTASDFWQRVSGSTITSFTGRLDAEHLSICVKSRISTDGRKMAVVRQYFHRL